MSNHQAKRLLSVATLRGWGITFACSFVLIVISWNLSAATDLRPFTVEDSIEMSYVVNPGLWTVNQENPAGPILSPDGRRFLLITQRGVLATNQLESTIWLFDRQAVLDFLMRKGLDRPVPTKLARFQATSNTPVVTDVRWLDDSVRIAFLAKTDNNSMQLYVVDSNTSVVTRLTQSDQPVSAYDLQGETIVYTTLDEVKESSETQDNLIDVTGTSIWALLWRNRRIEDRDESTLLTLPNTLHLIENSHELMRSFTFEGRALKLFYPILSLSPDGKSLITIAPVSTIPAEWKAYEPRFGYEDLRLDHANTLASDPANAWKASQFVIVDLKTGIATPVIDAPAGRSLFHVFAPTKAIWSPDSIHVLLSDTFMPLVNETNPANTARKAAPAAVLVDIRRHEFQLITYLPQPARNVSTTPHVSDIKWNSSGGDVVLTYANTPDNIALSLKEIYRRKKAGWSKIEISPVSSEPPRLSIDQDLNRPPVLVGTMSQSEEATLIWDPNPQLSGIALGNARLYEWHDAEGSTRTGILVLPPDYKTGSRYPLLIQTHGFEPRKFFADGIYTTGNGGRALCGRGIIVLQVDQYSKSDNPEHDAQIEVEAFRSAIQNLSADGLVDPKRVGIVGFSFTVYHVLYALTHNPELFAAATITDGNDMSYWLYLLWTDIPFAQQMAESANGGVRPFGRAGLSRWDASAPGFNLDRIQAPLLISCLEKGTLVATWDIYGALRTLKKPVDMVWLKKEDAPHVLVQPHHRFLSQEMAVDWFDFWLNGHEDQRTEKAKQYTEWRMLREQMQAEPTTKIEQ